jgi:hypothetical protein
MAGDGLTGATRRRRVYTLPNGKDIELEAIGVRDYAQIREQACAEYKRQLIQTYVGNLDLLPEDKRAAAHTDAFEKASMITPDDLPKKTVEDPVTGKPKTLNYADWWMGMTVPGVLFSVWLSMRKSPTHAGITQADVEKMFEDNFEAMNNAGDEIADLSRPRLGNQHPAAASAGATVA